MAPETGSHDFRCGFVAVVGRPNVGKSTLINALVGNKVSIVTAKPQTTRHRILAILQADNAQVLFVDTPGLHRSAGKAMNRLMNRTAASALADADLLLFVIEAGRWTEEDADVLGMIKESGVPAIAVLNKVDKLRRKDSLLQELATLAGAHSFLELVPVSASKGSGLEALQGLIVANLPVSGPLYPDTARTDRGPEFHAAETIREKLTLALHQELPYGLTVAIERYEEKDGKLTISAIIWVERDSQKGIVVGKSGGALKKIGRAARVELKEQLGKPVHLELWVKVRHNWADSEQDLKSLGFDLP
ncbi:MAG TPA: GTPase Era [Woeseiaceae bacterium]|nr:GTPase Era [Woeseiaceae bacterium]